MSTALTPIDKSIDALDRATPQGVVLVSALQAFVGVAGADKSAFDRLLSFFTAQIRNKNTREAYGRAVRDFFTWCTDNEIGELVDIEPVHIGAYIEHLGTSKSAPTVKQHLAAIKRVFDWLVTGGVLAANPATVVRGPKYSQTKGKTPVLLAEDARRLLNSIPTESIVGLRDRAIIGLMTYTFARVSAAMAMSVEDVFPMHHRLWIRLHEKGGKYHEMPCHHNLEMYLREYMDAAEIRDDVKGALFRTIDSKTKDLSERRLHRTECLMMIRRRVKKTNIETPGICNHTFRGSGITAYLSNPEARLELAQQMAAHADPKTTRMYDRRSDEVSLDEVEKIGI